MSKTEKDKVVESTEPDYKEPVIEDIPQHVCVEENNQGNSTIAPANAGQQQVLPAWKRASWSPLKLLRAGKTCEAKAGQIDTLKVPAKFFLTKLRTKKNNTSVLTLVNENFLEAKNDMK